MASERESIDEAGLLKAIIKRHAHHGRCSQQDLADDLGVSKAGIRHRVHQLADEGVIVNERDKIRPVANDEDGFVEGTIKLFVQGRAGKGITGTFVIQDLP